VLSPALPPSFVAPTRPPAPTPTQVPTPPKLTKLTGDGCCAGPRWLPDGSGVVYYGYDAAGGWRAGALGAWAVPRGGGTVRAYGPGFGTFSPSGRLVAYRDGGTTTVARGDGTPLGTLVTGPALLFLAPTDDRIAWLVPDPALPQVSTSLEPPARVRVATIGAEGVGAARALDPIVRAEVLAWLPDGRHLALSTRDERGLNGAIVVLDTETGATRRVAEGNFLEGLAVAPDGTGLVYTAVLQSDPAANGVWYVRLDGTGRRRLALSGGYRWAPDSRALVVIPAPSDLPTDEVRHFSLVDGTTRTLVTAQQARFLVAGNDWDLAPDGRAITFRSAIDGAIWALEFGP
jgi:Tol biopolymer transport system component